MKLLRQGPAWAALCLVVLVLPLAAGKVTNENTDRLPPGCTEVAGDVELTVRGGMEHAQDFNGAVFTFDKRVYEHPRCTRVHVTFINEDDVRHQFMVHDAFPNGFFQIEIDGKGEETGTFILGGARETLLVHCGLPQHQQKGMKAEFLVSGGNGHIPNILGVSGLPDKDRPAGAPSDDGERAAAPAPFPGLAVLGLLAGLAVCRAQRGARKH